MEIGHMTQSFSTYKAEFSATLIQTNAILMSDIFDHLFAIIGSFDLAIYQRPSNRTFVKKYK